MQQLGDQCQHQLTLRLSSSGMTVILGEYTVKQQRGILECIEGGEVRVEEELEKGHGGEQRWHQNLLMDPIPLPRPHNPTQVISVLCLLNSWHKSE